VAANCVWCSNAHVVICNACDCCWPGVLQVRVSSDVAHVLSLPRAQLDSFLGAVGMGLASKTAILQALQQCKSLMVSPSEGGSVSASSVSRSSSMTMPAVFPVVEGSASGKVGHEHMSSLLCTLVAHVVCA